MAARALVFDLYDTLVHIARPVFQREVSRLAPAARRAWVSFERDTLMVTPYAGREDFVRAILERFQPGADAARHAQAAALLDEELDSVAVLPGVRPVLQFWKRRGLRLGVLSNAASPYREPLARLGLAELFDAAVYSCDEGARKPDPRLFATVCAGLGVAPGEAVMVGDSLINDVRAAAAAGLRAVLVRRSPAAGGGGVAGGAAVPAPAAQVVAAVADLAWCSVAGDDAAQWGGPLLQPGARLGVGGRGPGGGALESLLPLGDGEQGRYNLVGRGAVRGADGGMATVYVKRYLHPAAAHVEELVHALLPAMGIAGCAVEVRQGRAGTGDGAAREPFLISAAAPGEKLGGAASGGGGAGRGGAALVGGVGGVGGVAGADGAGGAAAAVDVPLAHEIGRHFACGFLLANADLRPRNAFLTRAADGRPRLVMVDHEYCLVNRALDLDGVADPFDRRALEALGEAELARRQARLVLTPQTMRRARRQFFDLQQPGGSELAGAFREGWIEVHRQAQANAAAIRERLLARLESSPPLVAGTLAYRRAVARFDVEDLLARIALEPAAACAPCLAKPGALAP